MEKNLEDFRKEKAHIAQKPRRAQHLCGRKPGELDLLMSRGTT
jgi:hypothetical protein